MRSALFIIFFLLLILFIYGGMNVFFFWKALSILRFQGFPKLLIILFAIIMVLAVPLAYFFNKLGFTFVFRILLYCGYIWGGLIFLFFSFSLVFEVFNLTVILVSKISSGYNKIVPVSRSASLFIPLLFSLMANVYGAFEARWIRVKLLEIKTPKYDPTCEAIKLVQISDIHLGTIVGYEWLKQIVDKINKIQPDILVVTGDLIDIAGIGNEKYINLLQKLKAKMGKFAVTGNHEFYAGIDEAVNFIEKSGFVLLRGDAVCVDNTINLIGVDDETDARFTGKDISIREIKGKLCSRKFSILLKHNPRHLPELDGFIDVQLSGHTHGGQIFPFGLLVNMIYRIRSGVNYLDDNKILYVTRGTGVWGPPIRFLSPPEIVVIKIVHGKKMSVKKFDEF